MRQPISGQATHRFGERFRLADQDEQYVLEKHIAVLNPESQVSQGKLFSDIDSGRRILGE